MNTPQTTTAMAAPSTGAVMAKPMSIKDTVLAQFKEAEAGLLEMANRYRDVVYDVATPKGMREAIAARAELRDDGRRAITRAEKKVKADVAELKDVMSQEVERLVAIVKPAEDAIDAQIKAQEKIKADEKAERDRVEAERVGTHRENIERLRSCLGRAEGQPLEAINGAIDTLNGLTFGAEWQEFAQDAQAARDNTVAGLRAMVQREEQRLENERLRAQLAALQPAAPAPESQQNPAPAQALQAQAATETVATAAALPFEVDAWEDDDTEQHSKLIQSEREAQDGIAQACQQGQIAAPLAADLSGLVAERHAEGVAALDANQAIGAAKASAAAADSGATMNLSQINALLAKAGVKTDAAGIEELGFTLTRVKNAAHLPSNQFEALCVVIARALLEISKEKAAQPVHA